MVQVKRNSREFKHVKEIIEEHEKMKSRKKLILLYALKPSEKLGEKVLINELKKDADTLYEMAYQSVLDYLTDRDEKLYREDKEALYYFKSSPSDSWIKSPFELKGKLKKQVMPLSVVRD